MPLFQGASVLKFYLRRGYHTGQVPLEHNISVIIELTLVRDCLLKSNPGRDQADALWEVIEKINKLIEGARVEQARKAKSAK